MATAICNVIPLNSTTVKLNFISWDGIRTDSLASVNYNGSDYDVIQDVWKRNHWCIVDASFADFNNLSRVIVTTGDTPPIEPSYINQFTGDHITTFSGDNIILFQ